MLRIRRSRRKGKRSLRKKDCRNKGRRNVRRNSKPKFSNFLKERNKMNSLRKLVRSQSYKNRSRSSKGRSDRMKR